MVSRQLLPPSVMELAFKTSSSKKRKILRNEAPLDSIESSSPSPDSVLPSCEVDDDPALSFSASVASRPDTPSYLRADSQPASSLPPRLQHQPSSLVSADYASSAASSPCASAYADLSIESDRGGDETGTARTLARSQSPLRLSHPHTHRVIMNGDADPPHRSSSPLKRRASSMDPENEADKTRDVDMGLTQANNSAPVEGPSQLSISTLPRAMSVDAPEPPAVSAGDASPAQPIPSLQEQVKIIETLLKAYEEAELKEGDKAYLVSNTWVQKALSLRGGTKDGKDDVSSSEPLGPVDNSDIIEEVIKEPGGKEFIRLKQGTNQNEFTLFPEDAWKMVVDWYGIKDGQEPIVRTAINTAESGQEPSIMVEFHPPVFTLHRLWSTISPLPIEQALKAENPPPYKFARSRKYHAQTFIKDIKTATGVPLDRKIRLFIVPQVQQVTAPLDPSRALTPPDSPGRIEAGDDSTNTWSKLLLDTASFSQVSEQRIQCPLKDKTGDKNFNGSSCLSIYDLVMDTTLVIDESIEDRFWAIKAMADKVWDITRLRDDSVIADLFTGLYKSTLKCPECGKISITFDPFNNLTLPIPVEDVWMAKIKFLPLNDMPVILEVELPKHSAIEQLKQFLSVRTGVPAERLIGGEEYKDRFFKLYDNDLDVSEEIAKNDLATFHELETVPTNWPHKTKKLRSMLDVDTPLETQNWDDPRYERIVVPVFHRIPSNYGRGRDGVAPPSFICFTKEEASDIDLIRRKVLEKVATFSTWTKLRDSPEENSDNADGEVVASASDADSSGDSKVVAKSVESEDDIVDVHMKDDNDTLPNQPQILKRFNTNRPKYISPDSFLDPELQNLFELCYFTDKSCSGHVPTGWSSVDHHQLLPKLSDRIPQSTPDDEDAASRDDESSTPSGNDDASSNDESTKVEITQTRMVDESSEEEAQEAPRKFNGRPSKLGPAGRRKSKGQKYGKKGNKRRERNLQNKKHKVSVVKPQPQPPAVADGGPLIRLGEGLVVDWNEDAFDKVFGGSSTTPSDEKGVPTFLSLDTLNDTALKIVQRRRQHRRTRGISLEECLDEFERAEVLSEQDMWYCPRCKEHRRASKKFDLWKSPDILVAHLKRFSSSGYRRDKLDVMVDFPIEGLDLTSRVIQKEDGKKEIYDLIAVDDHYGGLGGGHYTAYAKNFYSSATPVSDPSSCITSAAYLLFYRRRSSTPLGGSRFRTISEKYKNSADNSEDEDFEAGEGQRLGEGSSLTGLSSAGTGAAATHRLTGRGSDRVTVTSLAGPDDDDLPPYETAPRIEHLRDSVEDEGVDVKGGYQPLDHGKSLNLIQGWNFEGLADSGAEDSTGADIASDDVQLDSSADERGFGQFDDPDTIMTGHDPIEDESETAALSAPTSIDIKQATWSPKEVIDVPATVGIDRDSNEVAEIHLETEKGTKAE
ncbi:Ubiquitin carboxyl-terminal hydrolase 12 [Fusarium acuminatum]|uniref:ubiquitinyl hydrolase 1 n=1 Tax=Fusarium acuminatum TaxID=5515 RepID=A0ABZ2WWN2_9HYPO